MTDYKEYLSQIRFNFLQPHHVVPEKAHKIFSLLSKTGIDLEMANTRLPDRSLLLKAGFKKLCRIPRMSTFAVGALIQRGVFLMPEGSAFVNVGVWHGFTLLSGMMGNPDKRCIGIDNFSEFGGPREEFLKRFSRHKSDRHFFYEEDYRVYFTKHHQDPIGFYIYDGEHSYQNQLEGLKAAEPFLCKGAVILVDDTNWPEPYQASLDFIRQSRYRYEVLFDQKTAVKTHPTFWNGIFIFRRL
ncbi:MAG: class I SAM-dependent methyltransferase [Candidatus Omnitrophota bacterium]